MTITGYLVLGISICRDWEYFASTMILRTIKQKLSTIYTEPRLLVKLPTLLLLMLVGSFLLSENAKAQAPSFYLPNEPIYYTDFGYKKPVLRVATVYYQADSAGQDPKMLLVHNFDSSGRIISEYLRIFGEYGSETNTRHIYTNGKIDSLNVNATSKNFDSKGKYYYTGDRLDSLVTSGHYANHTAVYFYDKNDRINGKATYTNGRKRTIDLYYYDGDALAHAEQKNTLKGRWVSSHTWYAKGEKIAAYEEKDQTATLHGSFKTEYLKEMDSTKAIPYISNMRKLKLTDSAGFLAAEREFGNEAKVLFSIPISATNELGDLTKWYQIDRRLFGAVHRYAYRKYYLLDGTEAGGTEHEYFFQKRVERMNLKD